MAKGFNIRRSILILPANNNKFINKAHQRGADGIMLDLEDSVSPEEKVNARKNIKEAITVLKASNSDILVRINNDSSIFEDLDFSVHESLNTLVIPKVESADDIKKVDLYVSKLEREHNLVINSIKLYPIIETPLGVINVKDIARASERIESMSLGAEDYRKELGVEATSDGIEIFFALSWIVTVCKSENISPRGLLGSIAGFKDLDGFERAATRAQQIGCEGAACIHPNQVEVLNRVFSPSPEKIEQARTIVTEFEKALEQGKASISIEGKMVDTPVYERAKRMLIQANAIQERTERKNQ